MRRFGSFIKWSVRAIGVIAFLLLIAGVIGFFVQPTVEPSAEKAPWAIQTYSNDRFRLPSRIYIAENIEYKEDGTPAIKGYWTYDGKNFYHKRGEKEFPFDQYGKIDIVRRTVQ